MAITIKTLQIDSSQPITRRIMLYGDSNAGKTFLAGTAQDVPELSPVVVANIDKGATTLLSRGDIQVADIGGAADVEELLWMIARKDPAVANIRTLVLDGTSELQKLDLSDIAMQEANKAGSKRDKDANELRDYMKNKNKILRVLRMARDLPGITVILTAWAAKEYPNDNRFADPTAVYPDMTKAVRNTLVGYMDDVFYLSHDTKTNNRYLYTGAIGPVFAKCRDAAVAAQLQTEGKPYLVNPTFTDIYKAYRRAYEVATYKQAKGE